MSLAGWNSNNKLELTIDHTKVDEDLTDFPVLITLSSGSGQNSYDATDVFGELGTDVLSSGTALLLHMDGDQSASQHTVTINGNPQFSTATSKFNGSMYFDGTGDYLSLGDNSDWNFGSENFTIDFWMYATSNSNERDGLVSIQNGGSNVEIHIGLGTTNWASAGNTICLAANYSGAWGIDAVGSVNVCDSTWHHVAITKSGTSWKTYIDGVEDISTTYSFNPSSGSLLIGAHITTGRYYAGYMDELRISKGVVRWASDFTPPTEPYTTDSGTVLLLHMDGDQSNSHHAITFNGNPKIYSSEGEFNGSMYFDGTGDYLSIPMSTDWDFGTNDFTVDFWINPDTITDDDGLFSLGQVSTSTVDLLIFIYNSQLHAYRDGGYMISTSDISTGSWQHVAFVRYGNTCTLYLDGVSKGTYDATADSFNDSSSGLWVGMYNSTLIYSGYMDELRISKGIARWTSNFTPPTEPYTTDSGTVLLLHMDGDQSASQHTTTINGNPQLIDMSTTKFNGSMYFDGTGDYLSIPTSTDWDFGTNDFTIDWWFNADTVTGDDGMFSLRQSTSTLLSARTGGGNPLTVRVNGGTISSASLSAGAWCHIALVRNGNTFTVYLNGTVVDTADVTGVSFNDNSGGIWIGQYYSTSYPFQGYIDEFRISKGVARWTSAFIPPTEPHIVDSNTVLLLHMDGDQSPSQHTITMNGNPQLNAATYKFNGSMYFDGTGDVITLADSEDWHFGTDPFTIDFWINFTSLPSSSWAGLVSQRYNVNSNAPFSFTFQTSGSNAIRYFLNNQAIDRQISWTPSTGTWYHLAFVRDGANLYTFINGSLQDAYNIGSGTNLADVAQTLDIGAARVAGTLSYFLNGYMDELRISKGISRWTSNFTPPIYAYGNSAENRKKIAVTTTVSGIETQLPVEIEYWDDSTTVPGRGETYLWTKVPTVSSGDDTVLYFYYDKDHDDNEYELGHLCIHSDDSDGSTDIIDSSIKNHTITVISPAHHETDQYKFGSSSIYFDGSTAYLSLADSDDWDFGTGDFTIDFWMRRIASYGGGKDIVSCNRLGSPAWIIHISSANCYFYVNGSSYATKAYTEVLNSWEHYAYVRSGNTLTIYVDGTSIGSSDVTGLTVDGTSYLKIGGDSYFPNCYMDEFRISKGVARWSSNFTPPTVPYKMGYIGDTSELVAQNVWDDNFVMVYHMSQNPSNESILDSTSAGNNGTSGGSMASDDLVSAKVGKGLDFEGTDDYIGCGTDVSLDLTELTIESIIYKKDNGWNAIVDHAQEGTSIENYSLFFDTSSTLYFQYYSGGFQSYTKTSYTSNDVWVDPTATYSGGAISLYKDGVSVGSTSGKPALTTNTSNILKIGRYQVGSQGYANMIIDEVRVSNIARSPAWIKSTHYSNWDDIISFAVVPSGVPVSYIYYFSGDVSELSTAISGAQIYMYDQSDGSLLGSTTSSGDGGFYLTTTYSGAHFLVCIDQPGGEDYNNLIYGDMYPAVTTISG